MSRVSTFISYLKILGEIRSKIFLSFDFCKDFFFSGPISQLGNQCTFPAWSADAVLMAKCQSFAEKVFFLKTYRSIFTPQNMQIM